MDLSQTLNGQREEKQRKFVLISVIHCFHKRPHLRCPLLALHVISKMKIYISSAILLRALMLLWYIKHVRDS